MKKRTIWTIITQYLYFFFLCSMVGFVWEIVLMYFKMGEFVKRGFLYGPWLPVYGLGGVAFYFLLKKKISHPLVVFLLSMFLGGAIELASGWLLDRIWNLRYWDYSDAFLNLNGYVCLYSCIAFGFAGVTWVCVLSRVSRRMWYRLPRMMRNFLLTLVILGFLVDCAASLIHPHTGTGITF